MKSSAIGFVVSWVFLPFVLWGAADPFAEMAEELSTAAKTGGIRRVAVMEFSVVNSSGSVGGRVIQDRLISALVKKQIVSVVERDGLDKIKKELTLGMTGLLDESTTQKIGKVLGVEGLVLGSLSNREKATVEANARLVLVETGEILGSTIKEIKKTWLEPAPPATTTSSSDPLERWRLTTSFENRISTLNAPGSVLYKNPYSTSDSEAKIHQITLVTEEITSAVFDVEYEIPEIVKGSEFQLTLFSGYPFALGTRVIKGRNTVRIQLSSKVIDDYFYAANALNVTISAVEENSFRPVMATETVPFRKIWINPSHKREGYFLKTNPTMRITRSVPPILSWNNTVTLFGDFQKLGNRADGYVVLGGGRGCYVHLKILEWQEDRVVVEAPKLGHSQNGRRRFDPDLPYFLSVVLGEEHSNLFLVMLDSKGLPQ